MQPVMWILHMLRLSFFAKCKVLYFYVLLIFKYQYNYTTFFYTEQKVLFRNIIFWGSRLYQRRSTNLQQQRRWWWRQQRRREYKKDKLTIYSAGERTPKTKQKKTRDDTKKHDNLNSPSPCHPPPPPPLVPTVQNRRKHLLISYEQYYTTTNRPTDRDSRYKRDIKGRIILTQVIM